jgi:hypothetical protein
LSAWIYKQEGLVDKNIKRFKYHPDKKPHSNLLLKTGLKYRQVTFVLLNYLIALLHYEIPNSTLLYNKNNNRKQ